MTILDWALLALFGFFFVRGMFRGFLLELFDLVALLAGYLAARFLGPVLGQYLTAEFGWARWVAGVVAAVALFLVAAIAVRLAARLLRQMVHAVALGGFDRLLGAVFGFFKALLIALVLMLLASLSPWTASVARYAQQGWLSSYIWLGSQVVRDSARMEPLAPTRTMARWMREAGLNEEIVHIITDRPELMGALLEQARESGRIDIPVEEILQGEPSLELPKNFDISPEKQDELVRTLEDETLSPAEKARRFWDVLKRAGDGAL